MSLLLTSKLTSLRKHKLNVVLVLAERGEGRVKKRTMYLERLFTSGKRPKKVSYIIYFK